MKRIFLFIAILVVSVFINTRNLLAEDIGDNIDKNFSNEIEELIPEKNYNPEISQSSLEDIFGDEQTFPFIAGLGKNSAH